MIVVDKQGDEAYAVMDLDAFELLIDGQVDRTEDRSHEIEKKQQETKEIWDVMKSAGQEGDTWDMNKLSETEMEDLAKQYQEYAMKQEPVANEVPLKSEVEEQLKQSEEVIVELDIPEPEPEVVTEEESEEEDFGEEQFYLEPVE